MARLTDPTAAVKRAAIYPRVSDPYAKDADERGQETSLDTQAAACQRYAAALGYEVATDHVFAEKHTGVELWERPQLARLRELVRAGAVDVVIAYAIDRLSRDPVHLGVILSEAQHYGVAVEFVTEPLDDSPEGQLIRFVRGYAAKVEHEKIRERTMRGKHARVKAGKILPGRQALYGYCYTADRTGYEVDPITGPIVRRVFEEVARGLPLRQVGNMLTAEGVPTPRRTPGRHWTHSTVRNIARESAYAGRAMAWRYKAVKNASGRTTMVERPLEEQVALPEGAVPPLVEPWLAEAALARLATNKQQAARNNPNPEEALLRAGYACCGYCDRAMYVWHTQKGLAVYRCTRSTDVGDGHGRCNHGVAVKILDAAVWAKIEHVLRHPEVIRAKLAEAQADADPTADDLAAVDRNLAKLDRAHANYVENLGLVTGQAASAIAQKLEELEEQRRGLVAARAAVLARRTQWAAKRERLADVEAACRIVGAKLGPDAPYLRKRQALEAFALRARVWRQDHDPRYTIEADLDGLLDAAIVDRFAAGFAHNRGAGSLRLRWSDRDDDLSLAAD